MPGLRFLSLSEMQQNAFFKTEKRTCQSSGKVAATKNLRKFSKRARVASEPLTPETKPIQKSSRTVSSLPGTLIHLSQSADGKLRWDPPSSSTSSLGEGRPFSGCFSADCGPVASVSPTLMRSAWEKFQTSTKKPSPTEVEDSSEVDLMSSSLMSCCNCDTSDSSTIICAPEPSDLDSFGSHQQATSSSELSTSSQQLKTGGKNVLAGVRGPLSSRTCGLSPYLSSKLKPGKHILCVKKHQNYIRPGQLRHWAGVISPSLNLANLPAASLKGKAASSKEKACRTLAF